MSTTQTPATPTPATPEPATPEPATPEKESKVKSFFDHIGEWFKDHLGDAQSVEQTAVTALAVAAPLLNTLITLTAGAPIAAKVSAVVATVQTKLNSAIALLNGAEAGDPIHSVDGFLGDVQTNLGALLTDVDIKNSTKAAQITSVVNTLIEEIEAVQTATTDHMAPVVGD
jgi:hypothetical protein